MNMASSSTPTRRRRLPSMAQPEGNERRQSGRGRRKNSLALALLVGAVISAPGVTEAMGQRAVEQSFWQVCQEKTALVVLCAGTQCGFYRCRDVEWVEDKPSKDPVLTRGVGPMAQPVASSSPMRLWGSPDDRFLPRSEPVFIIPWRQPPRPELPPSEEARLEERMARPHVSFFLFPTEEEFAPWFARRGLNPKEITLPLLLGRYRRLVPSVGTGPWVDAWRDFIHRHPDAPTEEVWRHAAELCIQWNVVDPLRDVLEKTPRPLEKTDDTRVVPEEWNGQEQARVEEVLGRCAKRAREEVLKVRRKGRQPTEEECREVVEVDRQKNAVTLAMKLGAWMHEKASACTYEELMKQFPGRFLLQPRYRYDLEKQRTTWLSPQEEAFLMKQGMEYLRGTLVPDVIITPGDPTRVQAVYDFKFPCSDKNPKPFWRTYPPGHPFAGLSQSTVYQGAFQKLPSAVTPFNGTVR